MKRKNTNSNSGSNRIVIIRTLPSIKKVIATSAGNYKYKISYIVLNCYVINLTNIKSSIIIFHYLLFDIIGYIIYMCIIILIIIVF